MTTTQAFSSARYWEDRYAGGFDSGSGSRGRLAAYKADVLNGLARERGLTEAIDFGCGDGGQIALFELPRLTGVDVSPTALAACRDRFFDRPGWRFVPAEDEADYAGVYPLALSLDVVYHLIEDGVFHDYMSRLFDHAGEVVVIYASDADAPGGAEHVRHRPVTAWAAAHRPDWRLAARLPNPYARGLDTPHDRRTTWAEFMIFEASAPRNRSR